MAVRLAPSVAEPGPPGGITAVPTNPSCRANDSDTAPARKRRPVALLSLLVLAGAAVAGLLYLRSGRASPVDPSRLNLLLITLDTTRADYLGCYGRRSARTPVLDRLAREGACLAHCATCSPQTLPAHASIMTGLYPFVHGARKNGTYRLADANVTLAESLRAAGFDTRAVVASFVLNAVFGIAQGFDSYHDVPAGGGPIAIHAERRGDEVCADALQALREAATKRFFVWVHFYDPHYPYESHRSAENGTVAAYEEEIAFMDAQIGRLIAELEKLKLDRQTLIVVVGDHGEAFGEHGEQQHGYFVYDTTLHVPMIWRCPGLIPARQRLNTPVRTIDVAPTILDLLGLPPLARAQGASLRPLLLARGAAPAEPAYAESLDAWLQFQLSPLRSLATAEWKYILSPRPQLYHLPDDRAEERNVIDQHADVAADLREQLRRLIADAPAAASAEDSALSLSSAELAQLQSLGYVGGAAPSAETANAELDLFEPRGGDPQDHIQVLTQYCQSHWALMAGEWILAERLLRPVITAMPMAARVRGDLAYVLQQQGRTPEAATQYREALTLDPEDGYVRRMYAGLLMRQGSWSEAAEQLLRVVADKPDDFEAQYNLGAAYGRLQRYDDARRHFEEALKVNPKHVSSLHAIGATYLQEDDLEKAAEFFRRALALDPRHLGAQRDLQIVNEKLSKN